MHKQEFMGVHFSPASMDEALRFVGTSRIDRPLCYVVTPNVDHVVRLDDSKDPETRAAYDEADLCLCDSRIVAGLAWLRGLSIEVVAGSDLIAQLISGRIDPGERINLIGGNEATLARLAQLIPDARLRQHCPPMGMLQKPAAMADAVQFIIDNPAEVTLLAIGSPQQEIIAHRAARSGMAFGTALCIGASIDFITGEKRRAPRVMQRLGLEWLFRLVSEPRRLWRRYLLSSPKVFRIAARWRPSAAPVRS